MYTSTNAETLKNYLTDFRHLFTGFREISGAINARIRRYAIPFRNDRAISAGVGNFAPFCH